MHQSRLSRRKFLASGIAATTTLTPAARALSPADSICSLLPEQEQGPFYLDHMRVRSNIAEDRTGTPLRLRLVVQDSRTCTPLKGAAVDLWHCDAMGLYSGFTSSKMGGPGGPPPGGFPDGPPPGGFPDGPPPGGPNGGPGGPKPSDKLTFLRGIQLTGVDGTVTFETIFPGFYDGRTNHIHLKVRLEGHRDRDLYAAGHTSHTGQIFFPEDWNLRLMAQPAYAAHKIHRTTEAEDHVFNDQHGAAAIATLVPLDPANAGKGLLAELRVSIDPTATPKPVGVGGGPPHRS